MSTDRARKTRVIVVLEMEGDEADAREVVNHVLDFGDFQEAINAAEGAGVRVVSATVSRVLEDLRHIMWPEGRADAEWNADTIDAVGRRLDFLRPAEPEETAAPPDPGLKTYTVVGYFPSGRDRYVGWFDAVNPGDAATAARERWGEHLEIVAVLEGQCQDQSDAALGPGRGVAPPPEPAPAKVFTVVGYYTDVDSDSAYVEWFEAETPEIAADEARESGGASLEIVTVFEGKHLAAL